MSPRKTPSVIEMARVFPSIRNQPATIFRLQCSRGGDEAEHFLRHDIDLLSGPLDEDERVAITSAARAWYLQHPSAQLFVVSNRSQARYFELHIGPKAVMRTFVQVGTPVGNLTAARDHSNQQK
jgi:hypothetical protein